MDKKQFASRLDSKLLKAIKFLSVEKEKPVNALLEEAIRDLLKKYGEKVQKP